MIHRLVYGINSFGLGVIALVFGLWIIALLAYVKSVKHKEEEREEKKTE